MPRFKGVVQIEVPVEFVAHSLEEAELTAVASVVCWADFPMGVTIDTELKEIDEGE